MKISQSRRTFIRNAGIVGTGLLLPATDLFAGKKHKVKKFGLQLYSLRDDLPNDPKGVLTQVASFGYNQIESFEGKSGIFWGMKNTEFKSLMDSLGMEIISSHCAWEKDFETKAAQAGEIGMKYLICPYLGAQKTLDDYKKFAAKFNVAGEICKKNGLRFAYHNHGYSFKLLEEQYPQDVMMTETDPALVDFEMDMYWVVDAGQDPEAWFKKYPNRFKLCHIKDRLKDADPKADNNSCTLGEGSINFPKYLHTGQHAGLECFIVEQERYAGTTPLKSAAANAAYMKNLKLA
jgi:sugar phosphate isomerase/epimerase